MRFFRMSHRQTLELPLKTFWCLNGKIDQIQAEEDMRLFRVMRLAQHGDKEGVEALHDDLKRQMGEPFKGYSKARAKMNETLDREGLDELRQLQFV